MTMEQGKADLAEVLWPLLKPSENDDTAQDVVIMTRKKNILKEVFGI